MQDHGGNIDWAIARYGTGAWLDLSTGINRIPYPVPELPLQGWTDLPTQAAQAALVAQAAQGWGAAEGVAGLALGGAQAAIQTVPHLAKAGRAAVLCPSYNEHAACLRALGWQVQDSPDLADMAGAGLAVVVNPNNPDGRCWRPEALLTLARQVGLLVVDESFGDVTPDLSLLPVAGGVGNLLVLRSFGKFYGLAGMRLGFAFGAEALIARLRQLVGPWPVSGIAVALGQTALADAGWARRTRARLVADAARLDALAQGAGWQLVGGTSLFRLYHTPDAADARAHLARHHVWSRIFPYSRHWLRLGLPGPQSEWAQLQAALSTAPR